MVSRKKLSDRYILKAPSLLTNDQRSTLKRTDTYVIDDRDFLPRFPLKEMREKAQKQLSRQEQPSSRTMKIKSGDISITQYLMPVNDSNKNFSVYVLSEPTKKIINIKGAKSKKKSVNNKNMETYWNLTNELGQLNQTSHYLQQISHRYPLHYLYFKSTQPCQNISNLIGQRAISRLLSNIIVLFSSECFNEYQCGVCEIQSPKQRYFCPILDNVVSSISLVLTIVGPIPKNSLNIRQLKSHSIICKRRTRVSASISTPMYRFSQDSTLIDQKDLNATESYTSENSKSLNKIQVAILSSKVTPLPTNSDTPVTNQLSDRKAKSYRSEMDLFIGSAPLWKIVDQYHATFVEKLKEKSIIFKDDGGDFNLESCDFFHVEKRVVSNHLTVKNSKKFNATKHMKVQMYYADNIFSENKYLKMPRPMSSSDEFHTAKDPFNSHLKVHFKKQIEEIPPFTYLSEYETCDEMFSINNQNFRTTSQDFLIDKTLQLASNNCGQFYKRIATNINRNPYNDVIPFSELMNTSSSNLQRNNNMASGTLIETNYNNINHGITNTDTSEEAHDNNLPSNKTAIANIYNAYAVMYEPNVYNPAENLECKEPRKCHKPETADDFENIDASEIRRKTTFKSKIKHILSNNRQRPSTAYIDLSSEFTRTVSESSPCTFTPMPKKKKSCCFSKDKTESK